MYVFEYKEGSELYFLDEERAYLSNAKGSLKITFFYRICILSFSPGRVVYVTKIAPCYAEM